MMRVLLVMIAGGLGAASRYGATIFIQRWMESAVLRGWMPQFISPNFPIGTLTINVIGSFLLAFVTILTLEGTAPPEFRIVLGTGFLGAFTTFSTFELESHGLLASGEWTQAMIYILGNLVLGFLAVILGGMLALRLANGTLSH